MKNLQPTNTSSFMAVDQHSSLIRLHLAATPSNFVTVEQHSMFISWRNSDDRPANKATAASEDMFFGRDRLY